MAVSQYTRSRLTVPVIKMGKDGLGFLIVKLITRYLYTGEQIRVEKISRRKKKGLEERKRT